MKVYLLYKDQDFDLQQKWWNEKTLAQDLELNTLFAAMASGDEFLLNVVSKVVFAGLNNDTGTILYRQNILKDCSKNLSLIRNIYAISTEAIESRKKSWFGVFTKHPSSILSSSIGMMQIFVVILKKLRSIADEHAGKFESEGFTRFFEMLKAELGDDYFIRIGDHLSTLKFREGMLISAALGKGNKGIQYTLRKPEFRKTSWLERLLAKKPDVYTFYISPRDEGGLRTLSELNDEGINLVANALAQSNDHILSFFTMLRAELAFYLGCLNLQERLTREGKPACFPHPATPGECRHSFSGLYDICLSLNTEQKITGNDLNADNKNLVIITGANQGGKSTFLRSIGLSQLMMQAGMFVPAESFCATICDSLFTHFKREEDTTMKSGKFDEELSRMSDIADHLTSGSILLFNESFAATNEREGSEIARQIVTALLENRIRIFFVTHLYEFAHDLYEKKMEKTVFLRAERKNDTSRTFKLLVGEPLQTSYGIDLYNKIFDNS